MSKFIDDIIDHKESDIEKIQCKPNVYIGYLGQKGSLHLTKEVINNSIDECINTNSPGNEIDIYLDEVENTIKILDNGRGISFDKLELVCTTLQSGSKFTREQSKQSAGENGVGLSCVNSLSELFEISSTRYGEKFIIKFNSGKKIEEKITKISNKDKHGTCIFFKPSPFFMGEECNIITEDLLNWIEKIIYLVTPDIKINVSVIKKGKESTIQKKYRNKNGLYDYMKKLCKEPLVDPIHFFQSLKIKELDKGKEYDRFIGLEAAFTFDSKNTNSEMLVDSFCNFVNTIENGVHVDAVKQGIIQYLSKQTRESLSQRDLKNIDIVYNDITSNLVLTLFLSTDMRLEFSGQVKEKVTNNSFFKPLRDMTYKALVEYFKNNPKELKKITDFIKLIARARTQANKVRNAVIKGDSEAFSDHALKNFVKANNKGDKYRELFIIEGDSALGTARQGRDTNTQALFSIFGVPLNSFNLELDKVLLNIEFQELVKRLKCNIGSRFDIKKLHYKKIIIMADSDVDGYRIVSLVCVFFLIHLPEIIKQGLLYKAISPLYEIHDKQKPFILDKKEYIEVFERRIRDKIKIKDSERILTNDEMKEFLLKNRMYLDELYRVANHFNIHPILMEFIIIHIDDEKVLNDLKIIFPEMSKEDNVISGIVEGKFQIIILDDLFRKRIGSLKSFIDKVNNKKMYYEVIVENDYRKVMSLAEFFILCQKYKPKIKTRFKGLGELKSDDLWETTMDPNKRILIQLTMKDVEKEVEKFRIIHGEGTDAINERKQLMKNFKIDREDLDN